MCIMSHISSDEEYILMLLGEDQASQVMADACRPSLQLSSSQCLGYRQGLAHILAWPRPGWTSTVEAQAAPHPS